MSKELPFFKFNATEWLTGNISYESYEVQGAFIRLCAEYWNRDCSLTTEEAKRRLGNDELFDVLVSNGYVDSSSATISIDFLNAEYEEIIKSKKRKQEAGRKGGLSRAKAMLKQRSSNKDIDIDKDIDKDSMVDKFLSWFNSSKKKYTGVVGKFKTLTSTDETNLRKLKKSYTSEDFNKAIPNLFKNSWAKETNNLTPSHFLRVENFNKYLNHVDTNSSKSAEDLYRT
jgi:hypothetical protein